MAEKKLTPAAQAILDTIDRMAAPFATTLPVHGHRLPSVFFPAPRLPRGTPLWRVVEVPEPKRPRTLSPPKTTTISITPSVLATSAATSSSTGKRANPFPTTGPPSKSPLRPLPKPPSPTTSSPPVAAPPVLPADTTTEPAAPIVTPEQPPISTGPPIAKPLATPAAKPLGPPVIETLAAAVAKTPAIPSIEVPKAVEPTPKPPAIPVPKPVAPPTVKPAAKPAGGKGTPTLPKPVAKFSPNPQRPAPWARNPGKGNLTVAPKPGPKLAAQVAPKVVPKPTPPPKHLGFVFIPPKIDEEIEEDDMEKAEKELKKETDKDKEEEKEQEKKTKQEKAKQENKENERKQAEEVKVTEKVAQEKAKAKDNKEDKEEEKKEDGEPKAKEPGKVVLEVEDDQPDDEALDTSGPPSSPTVAVPKISATSAPASATAVGKLQPSPPTVSTDAFIFGGPSGTSSTGGTFSPGQAASGSSGASSSSFGFTFSSNATTAQLPQTLAPMSSSADTVPAFVLGNSPNKPAGSASSSNSLSLPPPSTSTAAPLPFTFMSSSSNDSSSGQTGLDNKSTKDTAAFSSLFSFTAGKVDSTTSSSSSSSSITNSALGFIFGSSSAAALGQTGTTVSTNSTVPATSLFTFNSSSSASAAPAVSSAISADIEQDPSSSFSSSALATSASFPTFTSDNGNNTSTYQAQNTEASSSSSSGSDSTSGGSRSRFSFTVSSSATPSSFSFTSSTASSSSGAAGGDFVFGGTPATTGTTKAADFAFSSSSAAPSKPLFSFTSSTANSSSGAAGGDFVFGGTPATTGTTKAADFAFSSSSAAPSKPLFSFSSSAAVTSDTSLASSSSGSFSFNLPVASSASLFGGLFGTAGGTLPGATSAGVTTVGLPAFQFSKFETPSTATQPNADDDEGSDQDLEHEVPITGDPKFAAVQTLTGEEDEEEIWHTPADSRAKLYRFDAEAKQWKDRGVGGLKFLQHKTTGKVRLLMRSSEGNRVLTNHRPSGQIKPHGDKGNTFTWTAVGDAVGASLEDAQVMLRFASADVAKDFQQQFIAAAEGTGTKTGKSSLEEGSAARPIAPSPPGASGESLPSATSNNEDASPSSPVSQREASPSESTGPASDSIQVSPMSSQPSLFSPTSGTSTSLAEKGTPDVIQRSFSFTSIFSKSNTSPDVKSETGGGFMFGGSTASQTVQMTNPFAFRPAMPSPFAASSAATSSTFGGAPDGTPSTPSKPTSIFDMSASSNSIALDTPAPFRFNLPTPGDLNDPSSLPKAPTSSPMPKTIFDSPGTISKILPSDGPSFAFPAAATQPTPAAGSLFSFLPASSSSSTATPSSSSPGASFSFGSLGSVSSPLAPTAAGLTPDAKLFGAASPLSFSSTSAVSFSPAAPFSFATGLTPSFGSSAPKPLAAGNDEDEDENAPMKEEETGEPITGPPKFDAVNTTTGEEEEVEVWRNPNLSKAKLYRFDSHTKQWKDRGVGDVKFLRHPGTGKIRLVMRSTEGNRLLANHRPSGELKDSTGKAPGFMWTALGDVAEGASDAVPMMLRFGSPDVAKEFKVHFTAAAAL